MGSVPTKDMQTKVIQDHARTTQGHSGRECIVHADRISVHMSLHPHDNLSKDIEI